MGALSGSISPVFAATAEKPMTADCAKETTPVVYARKAELPSGVVGVLGFPMAEAGERFQATDVILDKRLPFQRFVSARRMGCRLELQYERGGIAHRWERLDLQFKDGKWVVDEPPAAKPAAPKP